LWYLGAFVATGARENLREMVGQAGKRLSEATRKTEGITGGTVSFPIPTNNMTGIVDESVPTTS
jgi:hypothetical protein